MSLETEIERELNAGRPNGTTSLRTEVSQVLMKLFLAAEGKDEKLADALMMFGAAVGVGTDQELRRIAQMPGLPREVAKLPIYNIYELAEDYRRFAKEHSARRYDMHSWLPGLKIRPLVPGEQVVIISDTGVGKTSLAQNLAKAAAPLPVLMFQLELPRTQLLERYVSMQTEIDGEDVYRAFENDLEPQWNPDKLQHIWTCDKSGLQPDQIGELIVNSEKLIGVKPVLVIIDYIQLVSGKGDRYGRISDAVEKFKIIAKNTETIFVIVSQVGRPPDKEGFQEPKLHSAKESGSIENSGGLVLGIWRDPDDHTKLWVKILKNTKGRSGHKISCTFAFPSMRITENVKGSELL